MASTPKTRTAVPIASVTRFAVGCRIAGPVQKTASFASASVGLAPVGQIGQPDDDRSGEGADHLREDVPGTSPHPNAPMEARATVTAGLRCAPLIRPTA